jgi:hypothetical protein
MSRELSVARYTEYAHANEVWLVLSSKGYSVGVKSIEDDYCIGLNKETVAWDVVCQSPLQTTFLNEFKGDFDSLPDCPSELRLPEIQSDLFDREPFKLVSAVGRLIRKTFSFRSS